MQHLLDGQPLQADRPFAVGDVQYPTNVLSLWSEAELAEIGVTRVPPPQPTLADLKTQRNAAVTAKRESVFAAGFSPTTGPLAGHTLQVRDDTDKINWLTSQASYSAAVSAGYGAVPAATFRTAANETVTVTYAEGLTIIVQDMARWGQAIMNHSWTLKDLIDAAEGEATLSMIAIDTGWP